MLELSQILGHVRQSLACRCSMLLFLSFSDVQNSLVVETAQYLRQDRGSPDQARSCVDKCARLTTKDLGHARSIIFVRSLRKQIKGLWTVLMGI